jgi:hypothetical protein
MHDMVQQSIVTADTEDLENDHGAVRPPVSTSGNPSR